MRHRIIAIVFMTLGCAAALAQEQSLSLTAAQPLYARTITATGRVAPVYTARITSRVSGFLVKFGEDEGGRMLDAGMYVKANQPLFSLDTTTFDNTVAVAQAALNTASANLANLTAPTRKEKIEQLEQTLAEIDARIAEQKRDVERYDRLVHVEKTLPAKRLEEAQTQLKAMTALRAVAASRLDEARNGATPTEIAVAQAGVEQAKATLEIAQNDLRDATVRAPFAGLIVRRFKSPGDYIVNMPPTDVLELVSADELEAEIRLPEEYFSAIQAGKTQVDIKSPLLDGAMRTTVGRVINEIDPARGTFAARIAIPADRKAKLAPGAFISAEVRFESVDRGVIVPTRAVTMAGGKPSVFVAENGKMVRRAVELGDQMTEGVVVKSGVNSGEKVVVGPVEALKEGDLPEYLREKK